MEPNPKLVGERIRNLRLSLGKSMTEFGKMIDDYDVNGKTKSGTVSNWETGKNLPNNERLKKIAELGNVSVDYLMGLSEFKNDNEYKNFLYNINESFKPSPEMESMKYGYLIQNSISNLEKINEYILSEKIYSDKVGQAVLTFLSVLNKSIENNDEHKILFLINLINNLMENRGLLSEYFLEVPVIENNEKIYQRTATNKDFLELLNRYNTKTKELSDIQFNYFKDVLEELS